MKYEWKKNEKYLYGVKQKPKLIDVPSAYYIMIKGEGNPNESDFSNRVSALYSLAYGIKMLFKNMKKKNWNILILLYFHLREFGRNQMMRNLIRAN